MIKCTTKLLYPTNLEACRYLIMQCPQNISFNKHPIALETCSIKTKS